MFDVDNLLRQAVELRASDIHLKAGQKPFMRQHSTLVELGDTEMTPEDVYAAIDTVLPDYMKEAYATQHEADFSHTVEGAGRFRVNAFKSQGLPALAFRHVKTKVPSFDDLNLPPALARIAGAQRGFVVFHCFNTHSGLSS